MLIKIGEKIEVSDCGGYWIPAKYAGNGNVYFNHGKYYNPTDTVNTKDWRLYRKGGEVAKRKAIIDCVGKVEPVARKIAAMLLKRSRELCKELKSDDIRTLEFDTIAEKADELLNAYQEAKKIINASA